MPDIEKIVVTGASSFVGCHLAQFLARMNFDVTGTLSQAEGSYAAIRAERLHVLKRQGVKLAKLDIAVSEEVEEFIAEYRPSVWIQHAGWAKNYGSYDYDLEQSFQVNVKPLEALYSAMNQFGGRGVIVTGTSAEYCDGDNACTEGDLCLPTFPYGLSKFAETVRAGQLAMQYRIPTRVARIFNAYGILDAPTKLLSCVVEALRTSKPIDLSPCDQRRDFLHVDDIVRGYEALIDDLARPSVFEIFNLCSGEPIMLKQLLVELAEAMGADSDLLVFGARQMRPGEPPVLFGSNEKAKMLLGWQPRTRAEGLERYMRQVLGQNLAT